MNWFKKHLDPKYAKICLYAGVTALVTFALGMLLFNSSSAIADAWSLIQSILQPIIWGGIICYLLTPIVRWVGGRLATVIKNDQIRLYASVGITLAVVVLTIVAVLVLMLLVVTRSIQGVNIENLKSLVESFGVDVNALFQQVQDYIAQFGFDFDQLKDLAEQFGIKLDGGTASAITGAVSTVAGFATTAVFGVIFAIYFLLDGEGVATYFKRLFYAAFGNRDHRRLALVIEDADRAFSGYIRGQFIDALIMGSSTAIIFAILGVPYGPILGMITGLGNFIPFFGGPIGYASLIVVCLIDANIGALIAGLIALSIILFIDGNIVNPRLLAQTVEVPPLLVVAALIAGGAIGGLAGMLIAVPTAAFIKMQIDRWMEEREALQAASQADDLR